jgi:hypothetical protein
MDLEEQRRLAREWAAQIKIARDLEAQAQKKREEAQRAFIDALNGSKLF